eukprot:359351_1
MMSVKKDWYYKKHIDGAKYCVSFQRIVQLCELKGTNNYYIIKRKHFNGPYTVWNKIWDCANSIPIYEFSENFHLQMQPSNQKKYLRLVNQLREKKAKNVQLVFGYVKQFIQIRYPSLYIPFGINVLISRYFVRFS